MPVLLVFFSSLVKFVDRVVIKKQLLFLYDCILLTSAHVHKLKKEKEIVAATESVIDSLN
jgi:hypothetical protein